MEIRQLTLTGAIPIHHPDFFRAGAIRDKDDARAD